MKKKNQINLADNTQGLITTKQTRPKPVASASPHPITPAYVKRIIYETKKKPKSTLGGGDVLAIYVMVIGRLHSNPDIG